MEDAVNLILALLRIAIGVSVCFAGYRLFRVALPAISSLIGGYFIGLSCSVIAYGWVEDRAEYWVPFFVGAVVCGAVAALHVKAGICLVGFCAGSQLAKLFLDVVSSTLSYDVQLVVMAVVGVIGAVLALLLKKPGLVAATSFAGASLLITGIDYFASKDTTETSTEEEIFEIVDDNLALWRTLCAICVAVFAVGVAVQLLVTAKGVNHEGASSEAKARGSAHA